MPGTSVPTTLRSISDPATLTAGKESVTSQLRASGIALEPTPWQPDELDLIDEAVSDMQQVLGGAEMLRKALGGVTIQRLEHGGGGAYAWWISPTWRRITFGQDVLHQDPEWRAKVAVVHELAHIWDAQTANWLQRATRSGGSIVHDLSAFVGAEPGPTCYGGLGAAGCTFPRNPVEEWAESFAAYCYPEYIDWLRANMSTEKEAGLRPLHTEFVEAQIAALQH